MSLLTEIPEPARRTFAHMTRLTTDKVAQLGLACLQERYPLPAGAAKNAATVPLSGLLVFAPATRYCPGCLVLPGAEDADEGGIRDADVVTRKGPAAGVAAGPWW